MTHAHTRSLPRHHLYDVWVHLHVDAVRRRSVRVRLSRQGICRSARLYLLLCLFCQSLRDMDPDDLHRHVDAIQIALCQSRGLGLAGWIESSGCRRCQCADPRSSKWRQAMILGNQKERPTIKCLHSSTRCCASVSFPLLKGGFYG